VDRHELLVLITNGVDYEERLKRTGRERWTWEGRAALTPNGGEWGIVWENEKSPDLAGVQAGDSKRPPNFEGFLSNREGESLVKFEKKLSWLSLSASGFFILT